ncbi:rare lipoprotein A [Deinococcus proteolyticus MRP]|uniref:Probable endolytic peptidoglycan transglycosylase RlpA n=1 Tax=Deinococcus proteolyticus (strain ATCC 35074 / DSM 20540 / JCM 6276 / NBRC 101906 / NCIMB 13154 / VKM Ac-1939 / CCM 2703 / MRP) TaxID=693977 RepID=F0RMY2_DEIPM|nr:MULTISPECIES: septal ring lytic transglycosylase RlpA family protein [Deinococcus]ADY26124.1 rare lipoprotein A [Deinococcus proteolyticus MRP]
MRRRSLLAGGLTVCLSLFPALAVAAPSLGALQLGALQLAQGAGVYQRGKAVYYGGRPDPETRMTAAHLTLPFGTWVRVTHVRTGRSVRVKINDRGPFNGGGRIIDLSRAAAQELGILREGVAPVTLTVLSRP